MSGPEPSSTGGAAPPAPTHKPSQPPSTPRDARIIALILASMGVESASEGVVRMLMEFAHRYTSDILTDALVFSEHAGKAHAAGGPDQEDVRLAVQAKTEHSMAGPMTKEFLLTLADQLNRHPLPPLPERYGVRLPPEKDRLTAPNFDIIPLGPSDTATPGRQRNSGSEDEDGDVLFGGDDDADGDGSGSGSGSDESFEDVPGVNGIAEGTSGVNGNGAPNGDGKRRLEDMEDDDYD